MNLLNGWVRYSISGLAAFIALSTIGGGIVILAGIDKFPLTWLQNTPFTTYTIPALVLMLVVGGSSLVSAVTVFTGSKVGLLASMVAGLIMAGWIITEIFVINAPKPSIIEILYLSLGVVLSVVSYLEHRR